MNVAVNVAKVAPTDQAVAAPLRLGSAWLVAVVVFVAAFAVRFWVGTHIPLNSDEAVQGIAILDLLQHGHVALTYPGQSYGGMIETLFQAPLQAIAPGNTTLLRLPLQVFNALSCSFLALFVFALLRSRFLALVAGMLAVFGSTGFVLYGSWEPAGYSVGTFMAISGLLLCIRFIESPSLKRGVVPAVAFTIAGYSQPVSLLLVLPMLILIVTIKRPSAWRRDSSLLRRRKWSNLLFPRLLLVVIPMLLVLVAQRLLAAVHMNDRIGDSVVNLDTDKSRSITDALGVTTSFPVAPSGHLGANQSMTWFAFNLGHVSMNFAVLCSWAVWILAVMIVIAFSILLFRREPSVVQARLGAVAGALVCLALLFAGYAVLVGPLGRYAFSAALIAPVVVVVLVSCLPQGAWQPVGVISVLATAGILLSDVNGLPYAGAKDRELASLAAALPADYPLVGDYWDVYTLQFVSVNRLQAIPLQVNRFPGKLHDELSPRRTKVTLLVPQSGNPIGGLSDQLLAGCQSVSAESIQGRQVLTLSCPNRLLRVSSPPAYQ